MFPEFHGKQLMNQSGDLHLQKESHKKKNAPWSETKFSIVIILKKKSYHLNEELIHKKEDIKLH